jgi:hypothetical protein
MSKQFNLIEAAADDSRAMEADTISKHGRSSKSHTSRKNFLAMKGVNLLFMFSVCAIFFSCSSPERDGKKAAKAFCDCIEKYDYRNNSDEYGNCIKKAREMYEKAEKKYGTNEQKISEFKHAYEVTRGQCVKRFKTESP